MKIALMSFSLFIKGVTMGLLSKVFGKNDSNKRIYSITNTGPTQNIWIFNIHKDFADYWAEKDRDELMNHLSGLRGYMWSSGYSENDIANIDKDSPDILKGNELSIYENGEVKASKVDAWFHTEEANLHMEYQSKGNGLYVQEIKLKKGLGVKNNQVDGDDKGLHSENHEVIREIGEIDNQLPINCQFEFFHSEGYANRSKDIGGLPYLVIKQTSKSYAGYLEALIELDEEFDEDKLFYSCYDNQEDETDNYINPISKIYYDSKEINYRVNASGEYDDVYIYYNSNYESKTFEDFIKDYKNARDLITSNVLDIINELTIDELNKGLNENEYEDLIYETVNGNINDWKIGRARKLIDHFDYLTQNEDMNLTDYLLNNVKPEMKEIIEKYLDEINS